MTVSLPDAETVPRDGQFHSQMRRGMAISVAEGMVVGGLLATSEYFMVPLLQVHLHTSASIIGLLTIIPFCTVTLAGPWVGNLIKAMGGNKRCVQITCTMQVVFLLALSLPLTYANTTWAVPVGMALAIGIATVGTVGGPAWTSWMGDLVPRRLLGRYLTFRSRLAILCKLAFAAAFTAVLSYLPQEDNRWGLQIILLAAAMSRIGSVLLISRQPEPKPRTTLIDDDTQRLAARGGMPHFLRTIFSSDLGRWTVVWAVPQFGVMFAGPFFAVYMLAKAPDGLSLSYWPYILLLTTSTMTRIVVYPLVSQLIDLFGSRAMLRVAVCGIALVSLPWAFTTNFGALIVTEMVSGLCWCIAEICIQVLQFSCHLHPAHRGRLIGYQQAIIMCSAVCGTITGSLLLLRDTTPGSDVTVGHLLPTLLGSPFHTLFLLSTILRLPAVILAWKLLPALRVLNAQERLDLWRTVSGTSLVQTFGRGLAVVFRN